MFVFPSVDSTPHSTLRAYLKYMYLHIIMYKIAIESTENPFIHCVHDCLAHNRSLTKYDAEYVYLLCIVHIYIRTYMEVVLCIVCVSFPSCVAGSPAELSAARLGQSVPDTQDPLPNQHSNQSPPPCPTLWEATTAK